MKKIGAIIQARVSSTRLPAKALKKLPFNSDVTVLEQIIRRLKKSVQLNEIILATTTEKNDSSLVKIAAKEKIGCFRGSKEDVLSRYYLAAKEHNLDVIVRITGDCPCIDPEIMDSIIESHIKEKGDYASNTLERGYPHGLDVEVFNSGVLEKAHNKAKEKFEREHVTPYIYRNAHYKLIKVKAPQHLHAPDIRITLDTEEDYALLCAVYDYLYDKDESFNTKQIIDLFQQKPWLRLINKKIRQKIICNSLEEEMTEAMKVLAQQDLLRVKNLLKSREKHVR